MKRSKPETPTMPAVDVEADFIARRALSIQHMHDDRRSDAPLVAEIRAAYLKSPAVRLGLRPMIEPIEREPGQDDE